MSIFAWSVLKSARGINVDWEEPFLTYDSEPPEFVSWIYRAGAGGMAFNSIAAQLANPAPADWTKLSYFALGRT